jgi:glycerol-3-phosphate dehydrogenase
VTGRSSFDVAVVGGGATGAGLVRDLAMRGLRCLLVEQGDLCHGTSGRFHGLLHSGARYVVTDPDAARECIAENRVVRRIAPRCVEDVGGLFCWLRGDDEDYPERFLAGCAGAGVDVEEVGVEAARAGEPLLTDALARAFRVPDAAVNSFQLAESNAAAARAMGAVVRTRCRLVGMDVGGGAVRGVEVESSDGARERFEVGAVASAAGAWAGRVAALAGVRLDVTAGWGVMVVMNQRLCRQVVNRCRPPGDGDIVVPVGTVCIAGTTDRALDLLEGYRIGRDQVADILRTSAEMIPSLLDERALRAFAGARPLYDPGRPGAESRSLTRAHTVLDHASDGVQGLVSIVGGKLTTYRLMAEETADVICRRLEVTAPCRTAEVPLPEPEPARWWALGTRLAANEAAGEGADAELVCECELVPRAACEAFLAERPDADLEDMLRGLRLGMGPCQGCFCSPRAAALVRSARGAQGGAALAPLSAFLEERFQGGLPVLWGDGARQVGVNEIVYREVLALDHGPGSPS